MKTIIALVGIMLSVLSSYAQLEEQLEVLNRTTALPAVNPATVEQFQNLIKSEQIDYLMVFNFDTVNVFYYRAGELNVLKPGTYDIVLAVRDQAGRVVEYPYLFFDRSSYIRRIGFTVGLCRDCRNSSIGVQFGFLDK